MSNLRSARTHDVSRLVELSERQRQVDAANGNPFYQVASNYREAREPWIRQVVEADDAVAIVYEANGIIDGMALGRLWDAPPVYAPGGKVCFIDDFVVEGDWATKGKSVIEAVDARVKSLGGVLTRYQCVLPAAVPGCAARLPDRTEMREFLLSAGFTVASEWFCRDSALPAPDIALVGSIVPATPEDVSRIVELCEQQRVEYETFQPVFWKKAADSAEKQAPYLHWVVAGDTRKALVLRVDGEVVGFIVADPSASSPLYDWGGASCNVDDFRVDAPDRWMQGAWLLHRAVTEAEETGAAFTQVICAAADIPKRSMLLGMGYVVGHEWLVRAID